MEDEYINPIEVLQSYIDADNIVALGSEVEDRIDTEDSDYTSFDAIGQLVFDEYDYDEKSRSDWLKNNEQGLELAKQTREGRKYAGEAIADVKYPTIAAAAIQYAARAYPAIVKDEEVVKYHRIGADPDGMKSARGARVAQYMNWELLENIENWDMDMDRLLFSQAVVGIYFKKIYRDPVTGKNCIELVHPEDMVVYYESSSFEEAHRKTQKIYMTHNEYIENVRSDTFVPIENIKKPDNEKDSGLHVFLEQHRNLDLDGDGYEEPYVVTVHEDTKKVVRITARYDRGNIQINEDTLEIKKIDPIEYFVAYPFMPSFDGGVYGMGFGILLGPINESINTLFNQILDAGTRSNFQSGFIGKDVKPIRGGEAGVVKFKRGEWKKVQAFGDDLRKAIFPLTPPEPSAVLFQLLGFLSQAAKELSSHSDLLSGQQQQHNVPATSTLALIEQGLMVFSGIYKRIYRSLRQEYRRLHWLNAKYLTKQQYLEVIDDQTAGLEDWVIRDHDIRPVSTTAAITETQKYLKAQSLMQLSGKGLDDMEINKYYLEALGIPDVQRFMPKQPPQPPPQFTVAMRELDIREKELALKAIEINAKGEEIAAKINEMRERSVKLRADSMEALAKAESMESGSQLQVYRDLINDLLTQVFLLEKAQEQQRQINMPETPPLAVQGNPPQAGTPPATQPPPQPAPGQPQPQI